MDDLRLTLQTLSPDDRRELAHFIQWQRRRRPPAARMCACSPCCCTPRSTSPRS
ncbi:MAG: hypothetical protein WKG07_09435 [Hymenobacter sp.]